ncbi:hypothetical protein LSH36_374g03034 [Paralvinella palmiformis]|uniref:Uncharacterized protein n=1 Tax=Paralvinella palmiformis TaxID=53620 RepID=A0AAD9N1V0_9ANNE|nr:hypothetical protein LSH36_374g03034 [Paralvinella palmiformis]
MSVLTYPANRSFDPESPLDPLPTPIPVSPSLLIYPIYVLDTLFQLWKDYQLQWDPSEYGGIKSIRILSQKVWKPDIVLFNNADGKYEVSYKPNVVIYSEGNVLWIPPAIYKSSCTIDVQYFPFDEQECEMKFGSWTFNRDQVKLGYYEGKQQVDLRDYVFSGTWDIMSCPATIDNDNGEESAKHTSSIITYTLRIRRKTLFYTVNLIIPCVLISFLSVSVFYLPADAGEKMTMCISILLALVVFLLLVSKILPPTSITIPLIAKYLLFTFIMNIFTILITVIIINWNFRTPRTHRMPRWVRVVFLNYLPRILFMKRPNHADRWSEKSYSRMNAAAASAAASGSGSGALPDSRAYTPLNARQRDLLELSEVHHPNCRMSRKRGGGAGGVGPEEAGSRPGDPDGEPGLNFQMTPETHKAIEAVRFIAAHLKNEDDYAEVSRPIRLGASVCLSVFLTVCPFVHLYQIHG